MGRRIAELLLWLSLLLGPIVAAFGAERFPPPEFDAGYTMPSTTAPAARSQWIQYTDVAVLFGALVVASYLVHQKRSRAGIFFLTIFSVGYFGFIRKGCVCSIGSTQDVALAAFNHNYAVPLAVLAFFLLPLVFTLFFGRTFCAAVCPLGAIQDLVLVKPVKLPGWVERGLGVIPFLYLGLGVLLAATGSAFLFCENDPFIGFFRRGGSSYTLALGAAFLLVGIFIGRPYCRFLCPYGAVLSVLSRFSRRNVHLLPEDCVHCQLCDVACPFGAINEPTAGAPPVNAGRQKLRVALLIALVPVWVVAAGWLGSRLGVPLSKVNGTVKLAEQVAAEDAGKATPTDASTAFRQRPRSAEELFTEALRIRGEFKTGGWILGGFMGLVIGANLVGLGRTPRRTVFEPDRGNCVACGRCYHYCPNELARVKRIQRAKAIPLKSA